MPYKKGDGKMHFDFAKALDARNNKEYIQRLIISNITKDEWSLDDEFTLAETMAQICIKVKNGGKEYDVNAQNVIMSIVNHIDELEEKIDKVRKLVED